MEIVIVRIHKPLWFYSKITLTVGGHHTASEICGKSPPKGKR